MLAKLIKDLKQTREELETTDKEWRKKVNTIDQQLVPILPLERVVNHEILLDLLPKKADLIEHEKVVLEIADHFRRIVELEGKGLPPELLEALRMLKGMEGLKSLVKQAGAFFCFASLSVTRSSPGLSDSATAFASLSLH